MFLTRLLLIVVTLNFTAASTPSTTYHPSFTSTGTYFMVAPPTSMVLAPSQSRAINAATMSALSSFTAGISYKQLETAVYLAAPTSVQVSLAVNGWDWDNIIAASWYQHGVDQKLKNMIIEEEKALQSAMKHAVSNEAGKMGSLGGVAGLAALLTLGMVVL